MKRINDLKPTELAIRKKPPADKVIAIAGNPNVGKSTVFNGLTGLNRHTGNWPGKTVTNAQGYCEYRDTAFVLVDIPGTYSLMAHSAEEEVARNFICFGEPDAVIVVCDATCLERNLNLLLQILEITDRVVACVNLMDEAKKKNIEINLQALSEKLKIPVVGTAARSKAGLDRLMEAVKNMPDGETLTFLPEYDKPVEDAISVIQRVLKRIPEIGINTRWLALRLLEHDDRLTNEICGYLNYDLKRDADISVALAQADRILAANGISQETLRDRIVSSLVGAAEEICAECVVFKNKNYNERDRRLDRILASRLGFPVMLILLTVIFWLTVSGANYPSGLLAAGMSELEKILSGVFHAIGAPDWLHGLIVHGAFRVPAWVVSVMLPPMAIFFPLFTLLEDLGYLPRIAFNLDRYFKKCSACGKQALTMCMGFGCNAAGVIGCRIIDSPRERLIAIITNSFVPCNGRFPTLIAILTMFFIGAGAAFGGILCAVFLTGIIVTGVLMTFAASKLLSKSLLSGMPSFFALELPPYRRPQFFKVIIRSVFDRTLFVLGRAVAVSVPAGIVIWLLANISVSGGSLLVHGARFLDPFARLLGLDGVILLAFVLGFPANEIVVPIIIMAYMKAGSIAGLESLESLKTLLVQNGWTWITAVSTMLFSLFHWPCSTTCLTIKKETGSLKWTAVSIITPTIAGIIVCMLFANVAKLFI